MDNFDDKNLEYLRKKIKEDRNKGNGKRAYTMLVNHFSGEIKINDSSRKKLAERFLS